MRSQGLPGVFAHGSYTGAAALAGWESMPGGIALKGGSFAFGCAFGGSPSAELVAFGGGGP
eukprot:1044415-Heterocapsa_arctica.AAC.1